MIGRKEKEDSKNSLGISKGVYAAGNAVKDGLIATLLASAAIFGFLQFGDKIPGVGKYVAVVTDWIERFHASKYGLVTLYEKIEKVTKRPLPVKEGTGSRIGLSLVAGGLISHFFQISGVKQGHSAASAAIEKHDAALKRIDELEAKLKEYEAPRNDPDCESKTPLLGAQTQEGERSFRQNVIDSRHGAREASI